MQQAQLSKRFYRRGYNPNKTSFIVTLVLLAIAFGLLIYWWSTFPNPAPLWSILLFPIFAYAITIWQIIKRDSYFYFDEQNLLLCAGSIITGKEHVVTPLERLFEVTYLPHTREVKVKTGTGTDFLKLKDGKGFVQTCLQLMDEVVKREEETKK